MAKNLFTDYDGFVEKFKPKKTTDDCYTPLDVYEAIKDFFVEKYNLQGKNILRPFKPAGDYLEEDYSGDVVVLDNPPFSILTQIVDFYIKKNIKFILFAPYLTLFSPCYKYNGKITAITSDLRIKYENGALVNTSFLTNLDENNAIIIERTLQKIIYKLPSQKKGKSPRKIQHNNNVVSSALLGKYKKNLNISFEDCHFINKNGNFKIFGGGAIISDKVREQLRLIEQEQEQLRLIEQEQEQELSFQNQYILNILNNDK